MICRLVATLLVLEIALVGAQSRAQSPDTTPAKEAPSVQGKELPRLPETEVVGRPPGVASEGNGGGEGNGTGGNGNGNGNGTSGNAPGQGGSILQGGVFSSPKAEGYNAQSSTAGSLVDVPNLDLPSSIDVIPEDLRQDQQALQIDDLLRDIGGAVKSGNQQYPDAFFLRGFEITSQDYRKNGFLDPSPTPRDFCNVERIEVLKGPASMLYGGGQPSGMIDLITKKPLDTAMYQGGVQFGSYNLERYTIDATGPIDTGKSLLYRINAAYEDDDSFRDFGFVERSFVSPSVTWVLDHDTTLNWEGEYSNDRRRLDTGLAAINGQLGTLPSSRFLGEPTDFQHYTDYRQTLMCTHRINEDWSWNLGGYSVFYGGPSSVTYPVAYVDGMIPPLGNDVFFRARENIDPWQENYQSVIANVSGKFSNGTVTHNVVLGTEQGWLSENGFRAEQSIPSATDPTTWLAIDAVHPIYDNPNFGLPNPATPFLFDSTYTENRHGIYVQDMIDLGEHWKVLTGVRYDHVDTMFDREIAIQGLFDDRVKTDQAFDHGSPRVGLVYQPIPEKLSYYVMYSDSFDPPGGGPRLTIEPLKPELGQTWEAGIKAKPLDKLTLSAAAFYITKQNITTDLFNAPFFETEQIGRQRNQGVELDAIGQLTERWSIQTNWCYVDTLLMDPTNPLFDGEPARGVPHNTINVWNRYNVIQEKDRTLGFGLGVIYVGERLGDYLPPGTPQFFLPGYTRWDAGVYYRRGRLDTALYLENLFDAQYYTSSISEYQVMPGAPFTVRAQVAYRF
jgi:iron complex outermembrane receptor protein